jgi:hypothetical protein
MNGDGGYDRRRLLRGAAILATGLARPAVGSIGGVDARNRQERPRADAVHLSPGVELFIDDALIARQTNLERTIHPPERLPRPVVNASEDRCFQPYLTVLRDPVSRRFRIWYNASLDPPAGSQSRIGYLESEDGIHWIRPHRVLKDPAKLIFGCTVLDEGGGPTGVGTPAGRLSGDPSRRYKLAWWNEGLWIAYSTDGLDWTAAQAPEGAQPVLTGIEDIVFLSRDPLRQRYLLTCKLGARPEDGYRGSTPNAREGYRRLVGQSVSPDCLRWSPPRRIIVPDARDEGITEFYSIGGVIARGGLLIGLLKVLRDDLPCDPGGPKNGVGYTVLAWSRDGERWERDREPFMPRNPEPGSWDHAMTWGDYQLPVGDELYLYYGGYARGHKVERFKEQQIGLARMPRDRYVSRDAGEAEGTLRTPLLALDGARLAVNAQVDGELRARLLDEAGKPLPGFGASAPLRGDSLAHALKWQRSLAALRGRPVRLEFAMRRARLYGFEVIA